MATKSVYVEVRLRDPNSTSEPKEIITVQTANGSTEDDGLTVVIPNGYVPNIEQADPADIVLQIQPPPTLVTPSALTSRLNNIEAATSILTFTLPG